MNFKTLSAISCIALSAGTGCVDFSPASETETDTTVNNKPVISSATSSDVVNNSVTFSANAFDADNDSLQYYWDFGDGSFATGSSPTHNYATSTNGKDQSYNVVLTVSDGNGESSTQTLFVTVPYENSAPHATITSSVVTGNSVSFTSNVTDLENEAVTYIWRFGDGNLSNLQSPTHVYAQADTDLTYPVTLTVTDLSGNVDTVNKLVVIPAYVAPIDAPIVSANSENLSGNTFIFVGNAQSADSGALTYLWNFGDETQSIERSPTHEFAQANIDMTYSVTLTVSDSQGNSNQAVIVVSVPAYINQAPTISASSTPITNNSIAFIGTAQDPESDPLTYAWDFGDGNTSTQLSAIHQYAINETDQTYNVTFSVSDDNGPAVSQDLSVLIGAVTEVENNEIPVIHQISPVANENGDVIEFTAQVTDADSDSLTYSWDFGDGSVDLDNNNPVSHTYSQNPIRDVTYTVMLTVSDGTESTFDTITVTVPKIAQSIEYEPTADPIFITGASTADSVEILFFAEAEDLDSPTLTYFWEFGDGATSIEENPVHIYTPAQASQTYDVILRVSDETNSINKALQVTVTAATNAAPIVDSLQDITVDSAESFTLTATASDTDDTNLTYTWTLDGRTLQGASVSTSITGEGDYPVTLTVSDGINLVSQDMNISVNGVISTGDESYSLIEGFTQHDLYQINTCGLNPVIDRDAYVLVDGAMSNINNDWSHVTSGTTEWENIAQSTSDYTIDKGYTANNSCNGANSINNILVKKYTDWTHQHGNGFKFPVSNDNASFADLGTITMDIYIDSANSVLPTNAEVRSAYSGLTSAQLDEFDDGEFYLDIQLNYDGVDPILNDDYATQGDVHGTINLTIDRDYADQWLRVTVPVSSLIYREEIADWGVRTVSYNDVKDLVPSDMSFVAETKSRKVYRHYLTGTEQSDQTTFENLGLPKLYKEEAIRIKYLEISKSDGTVVVLPPVDIDYSLNSDMLYSSGELYTKEDLYLYGSIEIRMKAAKGSGIVNGYFTYKNGSEISGTPWEEIDMEVLGKNNAVDLQTNVITGTAASRITSEAHHTQVQSLADDFHIYRMDWYPDRVEFFLDGQMLDRVGKENMSVDQYAQLSSPQGLRLNLWPANIPEWVGVIDDSVYPVSMEVDYMSYSSYDANTDSFVPDWTDGFETIDSNRWGLGNWTFGENDAKFNPAQVTTDGDILSITLDHYTGQ